MNRPSQDQAVLARELESLEKHAYPAPWCWEQCGEKSDDPVLGVAWRSDDETYTAIAGRLRGFDDDGKEIEYEREQLAYEWKSRADGSASGNVALVVWLRNHVPQILTALQSPIEERLRTEFLPGILHGDEAHQAWLREAVEAFLAGEPLPPPTGKGALQSPKGQSEGGFGFDPEFEAESALRLAYLSAHEAQSGSVMVRGDHLKWALETLTRLQLAQPNPGETIPLRELAERISLIQESSLPPGEYDYATFAATRDLIAKRVRQGSEATPDDR